MKIELTYNPSFRKEKIIADLSHLIQNEFPDLFLAVLAHGSVATNEQIAYSDFDGLLIVKEEFKDSTKLTNFLNKSRKMVCEFDPLQHHEWFILFENLLQDYPQNYFPVELFDYSQLIFPFESINIKLTISDKNSFQKPFEDLVLSLKKKISNQFQAKNDFQLKSYMSEIMLLPTLFLQAKYHKGVYKKDSFTLIKKEIKPNLLEPLELLSEKRILWKKVEVNFLTQKLISTQNRKTRKFAHKYLMPTQNVKSFPCFNLDFNSKVLLLINELEQKLQYEIN